MSATHTTPSVHGTPSTGTSAHTLTLAAYLVNLGYVLWFWVAFAAGYWVASWFGIDPAQASITDQGVLGWLAAIGLGVFAALPSLLGILLAVRAKRAGAGAAATVALVLNIALPLGWIALQVLNA
jgi:phosphotransferase system  glucose/maltose/N-acetylglucosamine-specific IIC component